MKKHKIAPVLLSLVIAVGAAPTLLTACNGNVAATVEVVYHLNYEGAGERKAEIPSGTTAVDWAATRDGFKLKDWYTDAACKKPYDFSRKVTENIDLYAAWTVYEGKVPVTFDYNYPGSRSSFTVSVDKGGTVAERYVPDPKKASRVGLKLDGWYKDAACTKKWDFASDTADSALTLYAGYSANNTLKRDAEGKIVYDNVSVNVWLSSNGKGQAIFQKIADRFNKEYEGKIRVNATPELKDQNTYSIRLQSTPEKSVNEGTYYSISDIYSMADIDYSFDDWYAGALRDSVYKGALTSVPMLASVPYIVYNKALMQKYADGKVPTNYSQLSALLKRAYDGEKDANPDFKSIMTNTAWTFKEAPSSVAFVQNGAEYYSWDDAEQIYAYRWEEENVQKGVQAAIAHTYDLFGAEGDCHGGLGVDNDERDTVPVDAVKSGRALMCLVNYMSSNDMVKDDALGILPFSGLFTDNTDSAAAAIPVHTYGLAFYKAAKVSDEQLAAGAVFVDYCSKHSYMFTEQGWYPVRKSCTDPTLFDAAHKDVLTEIGDPENFYTHSAYTSGKHIINKVCAEKFIVPMLSESKFDVVKKAVEMTVALSFEINN